MKKTEINADQKTNRSQKKFRTEHTIIYKDQYMVICKITPISTYNDLNILMHKFKSQIHYE